MDINEKCINNFLTKDINDINKFNLFVTMFHEMRRAVQYKNRENNNYYFDAYFMLKEEIIKEYVSNPYRHDINVYNYNYFNGYYEKDKYESMRR